MKGLVIKSTGSWYTVFTDSGKTIPCKIKGIFRMKDIKNTNPIAVGDKVEFELATGDSSTGIITSIEERKNYIIRKSSNLSRQYHILAANIDQAVLVITIAFPETLPEFIDRFLVTTEAYRIPVLLVFNKTDLYDDTLQTALREFMGIYSGIGYRTLETSVPQKKGIREFSALLHNKTSLIAGISGTGKSSLINAVEPDLHLKTGAISAYHLQGKHITTFYEMFPLPSGGFVIDSPGIKGFGLVDMQKDEIFHFFPEIFRTASGCQYYNCLHLSEPGCAVKKALNEGKIHPSRYRSYWSIMTENNAKYRA